LAELGSATILADGYDVEAFEHVLSRSRSLEEVTERLGKLLPHPQPLVRDLFCSLFKLNAVVLAEDEVAPSALINRSLITSVLDSGALEPLRRHTALDATKAAAAAVMLARRLLDALRREFRNDPESLLQAAEAKRNEDLLGEKEAELGHLEDTQPFAPDENASLAEELRREITALKARSRKDRVRQEVAAEKAAGMEGAVDQGLEGVREQLEAPQHAARGLGLGQDAHVDVERRLELGERIMRSDKLKRLARLVGAMRELAFDARRRRAVRSPQETHAVTLGNELERLLPSELHGLGGHGQRFGRVRRIEFRKRFSERQLLQYRLEAPADRGPMVICLDGSSSMQGSKELWGKAVALTLMEIARRERRRCLSLIFSSGTQPFEVDLLGTGLRGRRAKVREESVLRFAEHFPGGGTEFEPPLTRAIDAVTEGEYRRGDIVFITDGQARVSDELRNRIERSRKRFRFRVRAILVDVSDHDRASVTQFADEVHNVTDLASETLTGLFAGV